MRAQGLRIWRGVETTWRKLGTWFSGLVSHGDWIALFFGAIAAVLAAAHSAEFPSSKAWTDGHPLPVIQIFALALWLFTQAGLVFVRRRNEQDPELDDACREVAAFIDERCPELPLRDVGVRIWRVAGPPWARHLKRGARFVLVGNRAQTGIRWVKGKGAVGRAWAQRLNVIVDLEAVRAKATSKEAYEALAESEKLGLSWSEFQRTPRYQAVFACPLYSRAHGSGDPPVRGVLAIDLLRAGHFDQLGHATDDPEFEGVIGLCENALTPK